jgi:hypothetical protein
MLATRLMAYALLNVRLAEIDPQVSPEPLLRIKTEPFRDSNVAIEKLTHLGSISPHKCTYA